MDDYYRNKVLEFIPAEYLGSVKSYNPDEFITQMETQYNLYFEQKTKEITHMSWWKNCSPYLTKIEQSNNFEDLEKTIKAPLMDSFGKNLILHFNDYDGRADSNGSEKRWLAAEISSELFLVLIFYIAKFQMIIFHWVIFISYHQLTTVTG